MTTIGIGGPSDHLNVRITEPRSGVLVAALEGELSYATHHPPTELLADAIAGGTNKIILDLEQLGFCDSSGLRMLVYLRARTADGGWLRLAAVPQQLEEILRLTNLYDQFAVFGSVADALHERGSQ